jgi:hypothetical protein
MFPSYSIHLPKPIVEIPKDLGPSADVWHPPRPLSSDENHGFQPDEVNDWVVAEAHRPSGDLDRAALNAGPPSAQRLWMPRCAGLGPIDLRWV